MLDQTSITILVAIATLVMPALFVTSLALAGLRRSRGQPVSDAQVSRVTALGGASLGVFVSMAGDLAIAWPILVTLVVLGGLLLRSGRVRLAGWFVAGAGAPWATVGALSVGALLLGAHLDRAETWLGFIVGTLILFGGLLLVSARRLPDSAASPTFPGGRSFGDVGAATRAPAFIGPFGLSEVALLATIVAIWLVVAALLPRSIPDPIRLAILVTLSTVAGAEAYIRAMPRPARLAFEAFSWLGEWELAQARALTGEAAPTTRLGARRWLRVHPETPENRWIRVEMLTFVRRFDEARAVVDRMPMTTPSERYDKVAAADFVDWFGGGEGNLPAVEAAAAELEPAEGDERLRAEVAIAIARVRRRMAAGEDPLIAGEPLRQVRARLGRRADGQVGRALRIRIIRPLLIVGALLAVLSLLVPDLAPML